MRHPKDIGDRATLAVMLALQWNGYSMYVPFGENTRCDLVIESGDQLRRVQCKSGRYRDGAVRFATCSTYAHHPNPKLTRRDYIGEIEDFGVYCHDLGTVYLVPIDDVLTSNAACLRVDKPRNNQRARVRLAAAYEIARFDVI